MDTTKTAGAGLTPEQLDELRQELGVGDAANAVDPGGPATVVAGKVLPPSGKKRAGFTTHKGRGAPKAKRRMARQSRRVNRVRA